MRGVIRWVLPVVLVAAAGAGAAMAMTAAPHAKKGTVKAVKNAEYGVVLVAANGRTLYRYTPDRKHVSNCKATCLTYWPPLVVNAKQKPTAGAGVKAKLLGTITAAHGKRQVTYAGFPLYFYAGDAKAGQTTGQGVNGSWYVVNTKGALVKHAMKSSATTPTTTEDSTTTSSAPGGGWG
jgi:predicted lipoprotein with Yx(FWY)xxD motif